MASFDYNYDTRVVTVLSPDIQITVQELINSIATEQATSLGMDDIQFIGGTPSDPAGTQSLGYQGIARWEGKGVTPQVGAFTGISITLLNWKLDFQEFVASGPLEALVLGGNLFATDGAGAAVNPIVSTVNVATIAQAISATFSEAQANKQLQYQIESLQKETYRQTGDTFYVDPTNGDDTFDGLLPEQPSIGSKRGPKKTFSSAFALVQSGHHDGVYFVQSTIGAPTILDEILVIDKEDVSVRGPGPGFKIRSTSAASRPVSITGDHVEFGGVSLLPEAGGGLSGIECSGGEPYLRDLVVSNSNAAGVVLGAACLDFILDNLEVHFCAGTAIHIQAAEDGTITGPSRIHDCDIGIHLDALGGSVDGQTLLERVLIYDHATVGLRIDSGFGDTFIRASTVFSGNGTGQPGGISPMHDVEDNEASTHLVVRPSDVAEAVARNARFIEHVHGTHSWQGNWFYVDPTSGRDDWDGSRLAPYKTIQAAVNATTDNGHDVIFLLATAAGITETDEAVTVNKNYVFIRGPGRDFRLKNTTPGDVLVITGEGVEVSNFRVQGAATGTGRSIVATGELARVENIHVERSKGDAIVLSGISNGVVRDCLINGRSGGPLVNEGNGIVVEGAATDSYNRVFDNRIMGVGGDGIVVGSSVNDTVIERNLLHDGDGWGVSVAAGPNGTVVRHNHLSNNVLGAWIDASGVTEFENNEQWATNERIDRNADLIESQRGAHTWQGDVWYVDPANGSDSNAGTRLAPFATITAAHTAATNNNHDVIILLAGDSGLSGVDEQLTITKSYLFIRGPGNDFRWESTSAGDVITVTGDGVELSGFRVQTHTLGGGDGVVVSGSTFTKVQNLWIERTRGDGIKLTNCTNCIVQDNLLENIGDTGAGDGIAITASTGGAHNHILRNRIYDAQNDGISVQGISTDHTVIEKNHIANALGFGINIVANATRTEIYRNHLNGNALGPLNDGGVDTSVENNEQWATETAIGSTTESILRSVESRYTHQGTGTWYYVDPVGGNDANDGLSPAQAMQTFAAALALTVRHDVIYLLKTNATVTLTENLVINKEIHVRGPGEGFTVAPSNNTLPTIQITAGHVSLSNFGVQGDPGGTATACIDCSGAEPLLDKLKVFDGNAHGILFSSAVTDFAITDCVVQDQVDTGIRLQSAARGKIQGGRVFNCDLGIHLTTGAPVSGFVVVDGTYIFNNATSGILIDVDYAQSVISGLTYFTNNGSGQIGGADPQWDVVNNEPSTKIVANFYTPDDKDALFINASDAAVLPLV